MDFCNQPALLCSKTFNAGQYKQSFTFQPNSFVPVMLIGTIDFKHFMSLSVILTVAEVTRSEQSKNC